MLDLEPQHLRVVALRVQGKRWNEIAADLGVTTMTIWRWRGEEPRIDEMIAQDAHDYLVSSRHFMSTLLPQANARLKMMLDQKELDAKDIIAANKLLAEIFKAMPARERVQHAAPARKEVISDAELDRVLDADIADSTER